MNPPKCDDLDYINFLIAAQKVFSSVEASRTHPAEEAPAHDAYTRLLMRLPPDSEMLWQEVEPMIERKAGVLVIDDTTLDKPYASKMALVTRHWSGKHGRVVQGINLISLVWTQAAGRLPRPGQLGQPFRALVAGQHMGYLPEVGGEERTPRLQALDNHQGSTLATETRGQEADVRQGKVATYIGLEALQVHMGGQFLLDFPVEAHHVADVGQVSAFGLNLFDKRQGFLQVEM